MKWFYLISKRNYDLYILIFLSFLLLPLFLTFVHEGSHALFALCMGWQIDRIEFALTFLRMGRVFVFVPNDVENWKLICFAASGSFGSFLCGLMMLGIMYKFHLHKNMELFLYLYGIALSFDLVFYIFFDIFISQAGDWYYIFQMNSAIAFVFITISVCYLCFYVRYYNQISDQSEIF